MMSDMFNSIKDRAASVAAKQIIGGKIKRYASLESLRIDTANHQVVVKLKLAGERDPLTIEVLRYEIRRLDDGGAVIAVRDARADRDWLQHVLADFVIGQEWPLPERFAGLICSVLQ